MLAGILSVSGSLMFVETALAKITVDIVSAKPLDKLQKAEGELYGLLAQANLNNLPRPVRNAVLRAASQRSGQPVGRIQIVSAQTRSWPNGCLGVDDGTSLCSQALVTGWEVGVNLPDGQRWVFRTNQEGTVVRFVPNSNEMGTPSRNVVDAVFRDISRRMRIPQNRLSLANAVRQNWPDSCLGLAQSGEVCGRVLVDGWQLEITDGRDTWVYRTDLEGRNIRLEEDNVAGGQPSNAVLSQVYRDLSNRTRIPVSNFRVTEATQQTWSDGCFGLGGPAESCLFAQVPGWRVVVTDGRSSWAYRTDLEGRAIRLETDTASNNQPSNTLLNQVYRDLSQRTGTSTNNFRVVESTRQTWPDGCLGLYISREACSQGQVPGWRLVVSDGRNNRIYRTDLEGRNIRFEPDNYAATLPNSVSNAVLNDVANRTRIDVSQLMVVSSKQQTWPNSCLGLDSQGRFCSQGSVPGWEVTVGRRNRGERWIYRTNDTGTTVALAQSAILDPNSAPFRLPDQIVNILTERVSRDTGIPRSQVRVKSATEQIWSNGCLDLSLPNVRCMQVQTQGWRVELTDERNTWVYRTNQDAGVVFLEENQVTGNLLPSDISKAVIRQAAQRSGLPASIISIVNAEKRTWPNSCLGLTRPGTVCGAAMVPGWEVNVTAGRNNWTFRTNDSGTVVELDEGR